MERRAKRAQQAAEMRDSLDANIRLKKERAKAEKADEMEFAAQQQAELTKWKAEEEARKAAHMAVVQRLQREREAQLAERRAKVKMAVEKQMSEDHAMAEQIAYQTKVEFEKEEQVRNEAKVALQEYLQGNEVNKKLREESKAKQYEEDRRYMDLYAAKLDKQERARVEQLAKVKAYVDLQEARLTEQLKNYPDTFSTKNWISAELAAKYYKDREDARAAEEERRLATSKQVNAKMKADVAVQLEEKKRLAEEEKAREAAYAAIVKADVAKYEAQLVDKRMSSTVLKTKARQDLELQMKLAAQRERAAQMAMSETERQINRPILEAVDTLEMTGSVPNESLRMTTSLPM